MEKKEGEGEEEEEEEEAWRWLSQHGGAVETRRQKQRRVFADPTLAEGENAFAEANSTNVFQPTLPPTPRTTSSVIPSNTSRASSRNFDWNAPSTSSQVPSTPFDWNAPSTSSQVPNVPSTFSQVPNVSSPSSPRLPFDLIQRHPSTSSATPVHLHSLHPNRLEGEEEEEEEEENNDEAYFIDHSLQSPKIFKNKKAQSFKAKTKNSSLDYVREMQKFKKAFLPFVEEQRQNTYKRGLKVNVSCKAKFNVEKEGEIVDSPTPLFSAKSATVHVGDDVEEVTQPIMEQLENAIVDYRDTGSNFVFHEMQEYTITVCEYSPQPVGSYIATPKRIQRIKATINVKPSSDHDKNFCFVDSVLALVYPSQDSNKNRSVKYRHLRSSLNTNGIEFPIMIKDIPRFERQNSHLSINIYGCDLSVNQSGIPLFFPYKISKNRGRNKKIVNLLLLEQGENFHFIGITDLSRLTRRSNSKYRGCKTIACSYCLQHMLPSKMPFHSHMCIDFQPVTTELPEKGSTLRFKEYGRSMPLPYFICGDFETREVLRQGPETEPEVPLPPEESRPFPWVKFDFERRHCNEGCKSCSVVKPCQQIRNATSINCRLETFSWAYQIVSNDVNEFFPLALHMEENAPEAFLLSLKKDMTELRRRMFLNVPIVMTEVERQQHRMAKKCRVCKRR